MHRIMTTCCCLFFFSALTSGASGQTPNLSKADLVVFNAHIWTGTKVAGPEPTAIAVVGDMIMNVGTDADILPRVGPATEAIDAGGRRIIPGITDSHTHIVSGGFSLSRLQLRDVKSRDEFVRAVAGAAKASKPGEWVLGGRWSVESWANPESPNRAWIDPATGDTPVFLNRMDGHSALVNSAALKFAGIDANAPKDPVGGEIERDPKTHEPTGILKDAAQDLVRRLIPEPTQEQRIEALKQAMKHANSFGVTTVHDMSQIDDLDAMMKVMEDRLLTVRIISYIQVDQWTKSLGGGVGWRDRTKGTKKFAVVGFKGYMDGSMGSRNAYMREPYLDATASSLYPRGQLTAFAADKNFATEVSDADSAGLQLALHAIGDEANHLALDAYQKAKETNQRPDATFRIEHAQHLLPTDIPRFGKLGVIASMQPLHKADDGRYVENVLGAERMRGSYAFRSLLNAGATLIFGSDWPVVSLNPFLGIASAANAKTLSGEIWLPQESLTVEEAVRAYTVTPSQAIHAESILGTIQPRRLADLVVLNEDPFTIPKERIDEVKVWRTIMGGKVVYSAP